MAASAQGLASWDAALQPYWDRLSSDNLRKLKESTTLEEFLDEFSKFGKGAHNASRGVKHKHFWKTMNDILYPLVRFSTAIDVVAQINATIGCSIWGPLKLVVQICYEHNELLKRVTMVISTMGENVKRVNQYDVLFGANDMVNTAARLLYSDYINFCTMVVQYGDKSRIRRLLTSFGSFKEVHEAMREHEKRLDAAAMAAFMCDNMGALSKQIQDQQRKKQQEILQWIGDPPDYEKQLQQLRSERLQNSCDWFLGLSEFQNWGNLVPHNRIFWVHGGPGCGKTALASSVIDHLTTKSSSQLRTVLYAFCGKDGRSSLAILRSLMHQLLLSDESLFSKVMEDLFHREGKRPVSSFYRLLPMFLACLTRSASIYIIIDGIDELDDDSIADLASGLGMWIDAGRCNVFLMVLSQSDERIRNVLHPRYNDERICALQLELTEEMFAAHSRPYILKFVENGVEFSKSLRAAEAGGCDVIQSICKAADGHWLYARLLLEEAKRQPTLGRLKSQLQALPIGINNLYTLILQKREQEFEDDDLKLAKTIYAWVCLARAPRQMTINEISILLSLKDGSTVICNDDYPLDTAALVTRLCSSLLEIDDLGRVNATHSSFREYFQQASRRKDDQDRPQVVENIFDTSLSLAVTAATYISLDDSQKLFHTAVSLSGCAAELDKTIPLLSQVTLPLWDWYGSHILDFVVSSPADYDSRESRGKEYVRLAGQLTDFLVSHRSLPWLFSTMGTYGQHDLSVLFTRMALIYSIVQDAHDNTDTALVSVVYTEEVKHWIKEFPNLARRLDWNFKFFDVVAENEDRPPSLAAAGKMEDEHEPNSYMNQAFDLFKTRSFPEYGPLGTSVAIQKDVAYSLSEFLARYQDENDGEMAIPVPPNTTGLYNWKSSSHYPENLKSLFATDPRESEGFERARGLFYSGGWDSVWDSVWTPMKRPMTTRRLGLQREIYVSDTFSYA